MRGSAWARNQVTKATGRVRVAAVRMDRPGIILGLVELFRAAARCVEVTP